MRKPWQCSKCLRFFVHKTASDAHIRQVHKGKAKSVCVSPKPRIEEEESMADRAVAAELDRAMGIPNDDIEWLLP